VQRGGEGKESERQNVVFAGKCSGWKARATGGVLRRVRILAFMSGSKARHAFSFAAARREPRSPTVAEWRFSECERTARPWAFSHLRAATVRESETAKRPLPFCQSDTGRGEAPAEPHRRAEAGLRAVLGLESPSYERGQLGRKKAGKVRRWRGQEGFGAKERRVFPGSARAGKPELRGGGALVSSSFRRAGSDFFLPFFSKS